MNMGSYFLRSAAVSLGVVGFFPLFTHAQVAPGPDPLPIGLPALTNVFIVSNNASSTIAGVGSIVTLSFTSNLASLITPLVTIEGRSASVAAGGGNSWTASTAMLSADTEGSISFSAVVGNATGSATSTVTATSNGLSVIFDRTPPIITLTGATTMTLTVGDTFSDPGASAVDTVDGTDSVTTGGTVNTTTAGTYILSYNAADTAGNAAVTVARTVVVNAPESSPTPAPSSGGGGNGPPANTFGVVNVTPSPAPVPIPTTPTPKAPPVVTDVQTPPLPPSPTTPVPVVAEAEHALAPVEVIPHALPQAQSAAAASAVSGNWNYWLEILLLILFLSGITWWVLDSYNFDQ